MTTPNQPSPDGAYVIDGNGGETRFGQGMTETGAASLMTGGFTSINLGDPLGAIESVASLFIKTLSQIPLEVLQLFEGLIPDALEGAFSTVAGAIDAIFNHIQSLGPLLASAFNGFLEASYNVLQSAFGQIMDIVQGLIVTPINGAVAGFKDWFVGLMGGTIPDLGTAVSGAVSAAEGAVADLADLIHGLLTAPGSFLGNIPQTLVSGLDGVVSGLQSGVNDVTGFIRDIIDAIVRGIRGIPFVGGTIANAITNLTGAVQDNQVNQQNAVITVAASGAARNPGWVARYPVADVSYPEALNVGFPVFGVTGAQSTGTAHTHSFIGGTQAFATAGVTTIGASQAAAVLITTANSTVYDTVAVYLQKFPSYNPSPVIIEVYRLNSAGNAARLFASANLSSAFTTATTYVEVALSTPIIAQAGEKYMVKMLNASSTTQYMSSTSINTLAGGANIGMLFSGADATKTSYTAFDLATGSAAGSDVSWAMLATKIGVADSKSYSDDFNRVGIGSLWFPTSNTGITNLGIVGNKVEYGGTSTGDQLQLYTKPVSTDQMLVEANLYGTNQTPRIGIMSCCDRELTQTVYLGVNGGTANIYTGPWNSLTLQGSVSINNATIPDAKWGLSNDPVTGVFTILKNGSSVGTWTDTGGVVQHGSDFRYGGVRISRSSAGFEGGTLDNFTLRDA